MIQINYSAFFFPANSSYCSCFGIEKVVLSPSVLILMDYTSDILGESRSFSNRRWDELSWGKTFIAHKLLPVACLLFTSKGKGFLNWRTPCRSEPCRDEIIFGKGLHANGSGFLFISLYTWLWFLSKFSWFFHYRFGPSIKNFSIKSRSSQGLLEMLWRK